jgi:hypothetical protein
MCAHTAVFLLFLCFNSALQSKLLDLGGLGNGPTEDKTVLVFHTIDCLIDQLGVYKEVMKTCRNELFGEFLPPDIHQLQTVCISAHFCLEF